MERQGSEEISLEEIFKLNEVLPNFIPINFICKAVTTFQRKQFFFTATENKSIYNVD